jgi:hypothetical protein
MCNLEPSFEVVIFENCTMQKKKLIVMHDTTFSDHTSQYVEVYEFFWHRKWVVWHMNTWSYIYSIIL